MGEKTAIAWTSTRLPDGTLQAGATFNPWKGCFKVSPGCTNCYAEGMADRWGWNTPERRIWGIPIHPRTGEIYAHRLKTSESYWAQPLKWEKQAQKSGIRRKVFCASLADVFEEHPEVEPWRQELWHLIKVTPHLDWLLLTKRPENFVRMLPWQGEEEDAWENVWLGTSVENQKYADLRIPHLISVRAKVRFLSCEPLLGPLDLLPWLVWPDLLHWIIVGGESGVQHRPMDLEWVRDIRNQCAAWEKSFFMKQVGGLHHASGGHLLDGKEYYHFPSP